ncbi:MAG: YcxB family protein [Clostridia bacterium]|nr:YcxB family protein [Clostridia bacterium]
MQGVENEYIFCDNILKVYSNGEHYNGKVEIEYSLFVNVYETSEYFFLYQTQNQVYVIDKSTITGGSAEDIKKISSDFM